jgi:hypothetical protein
MHGQATARGVAIVAGVRTAIGTFPGALFYTRIKWQTMPAVPLC